MFIFSRWLRSFGKTATTAPRRKAKPHSKRVVLRVEELEERIVPSATPDAILSAPPTSLVAAVAPISPGGYATTSADASTSLTDAQRQAIQNVVRSSTDQIWFEQNVGQFPQGARYGFRTTFGAMLVYDDHLQIISTQTDPVTGAKGQQVVDIRFSGSNANWAMAPGASSGVLGSYQRADGTSVKPAIFNDLTLRNIYDGVDLRLYSAAEGTLEFDWIVARAQDYRQIRVAATGQDGLTFNGDGSATLKLRFQDLTFKIPESYQVINGVKQPVTARMQAGDATGEIRYAIAGDIVNDQPLVIDPNVAWSTFFDLNDSTTPFDSYLFAVAANANGVYASGWVREQITNGSFGNYMEVPAGFAQGTSVDNQIYIYRLSNDGLHITAWTATGRTNDNSVVTNQKLNGPTVDAPSDLELFPDGRVLEAFNSGVLQIYSANLSTRSFNGSVVTMDTLNSVAIVDNNSFYASGRVAAAIPTAQVPAANIGPDATFAGGALGLEGVIIRYSNAATTPTPDWATYVGGAGDEYFTSVVLTPDKTKLVFATSTMVTAAGGYPALVNPVDSTPGAAGTFELLVGVLPQQATVPAAFNVLSFLGGSGNEGTLGTNSVTAVVTAKNSGFWVGGNTDSTDLPGTAGGAQTTNGGGQDAFVSFIPINGGAVGFQSSYIGGTGTETMGGIAYDPFNDRLLVFGTTTGAFPTQNTSPSSSFFQNTFGGGGFDIFIETLTGDLTTRDYATYIGGSRNDYLGQTGALIGQGHVYYSPATDLTYLATTVHSQDLPTPVIGTAANSPPGKDRVKETNNDTFDTHIVIAFNINTFDFGDAPVSYEGTPSTPAAEAISSTIRIGPTVDPEAGPKSGPLANGDVDDDGITALPALNVGDTTYSVNVSVLNNTGATQTLQGWIDFNGDGIFDPSERAAVSVPTNAALQTVTLTWSGLPALVGGQSYLRLRLSDNILPVGSGPIDGRSIGTDPTGHGEIEDYALPIGGTADLAVTKSVNNPSPNVGGQVAFTVTVVNNGPSPATNVTLNDLLPAGLTFISTGTTASQGSYDGATSVWTVGSLANSGTATLTIQAQVNSATPQTNTAAVRTSDQPDPITANNTASVQVSTTAPSKSIVSTSETSTTGSNVTIGEIVRYRLVTRIGEGINNAIAFLDNLPAGLRYINDGTTRVAFVANKTGISSNVLSGAGLSLSGNEVNLATLTPTFQLPGADISGGTGTAGAFNDGDSPRFTLGTLNNADRDPDQEFVVVEFNALVDNVAGNTNGIVRNNSFTYVSGGTNIASSANQAVTIVEPLISTVNKTVSPGTAEAGNTVTYQVSFTNTGTATAFDVAVSDTLPGQLQLNTASVSGTPTGTVTGISTAATSGNTVRVSVASMAPGASVTINYSAVVQISIAPGQSVPNTARVTYTSLPGSGTSPNPTGSTTPGGSGAPDGERDGSGGINNYSSTGNTNFTGAIPSNLTKQVFATSLPQTLGNVVNIGEVVTYRLSFTMPDGTSPVLSLRDALPTGITPIAARVVSIGGNSTLGATSSGTPGQGISSSPLPVGSVTSGAFSGQNVTFDFKNLVNNSDNAVNAGDVIVVEIDGRVENVANNANNLTRVNSAVLDYGAGTLSTTAFVKISEPILQAVKTPNPTRGDAGDIITYTVVVSHTAASTGPAFDVNLTDPLGAGLQLIPGSVTTSLGTVTTGNGGSDTTVAVNVPVLTTAQTETVTYQARLTRTLAPGSNVPNTATANFDSAPGTGRPNSTSGNASVPVNSSSIFGFVYVDANNDGIFQSGTESPIGSVHLVLSGTDNLNNPVSIPVNTAGDGSYSFPNLRPGTYSIVETQPSGFFDGLDTPGTLFGGTAAAPPGDTISGIVIPAGSNASAANYNFGERIAADLALTKIVSNPTPSVGDVITYTLTLTNNGPSTATGTTVSEAIPAGLTFQSATPSAGTSFNSAARTWTVPTLANGAFATLTVTVQVASSTALTNVATISATGQFDPVLSNNTATALETPQQADLAVTKAVSKPTPNVGDTIAYTVRVTNNGPNSATNVTLNDLLPAGVTFVAAGTTATQGAYNGATGLWTVGTLAITASATLTIMATIVSQNATTNTAAVSHSDQFDPVAENNSASALETPQQADLAVTKAVSNATPNVGDLIAYTVKVTNNGPNSATSVTLNDLLPTGVNFVAAGTTATQGAYNGVTGVWTVGTLANTASATLTIMAKVTVSSPTTNTASVSHSDQFDPVSINNSASALETPQLADLAVTKTVSNGAPLPNSVITFTVTVTNNGPNTATNTVVADPVPAGLSNIQVTTSQGAFNQATGSWTIGSLLNGATVTLTVTGTVTNTNAIANTATAHADQFDPNLANNTATAGAQARQADLVLQKTVNSQNLIWHTLATYTFTVHNNGSSPATNVVVNDPFPPTLGFVSVQSIDQGSFDPTTGHWNIGTVANGQTLHLVVNFLVLNTGPILNTASVTAAEFDPNLNNNVASAPAVSLADPRTVTKGRLLASTIRRR